MTEMEYRPAQWIEVGNLTVGLQHIRAIEWKAFDGENAIPEVWILVDRWSLLVRGEEAIAFRKMWTQRMQPPVVTCKEELHKEESRESEV